MFILWQSQTSTEAQEGISDALRRDESMLVV